MQKKALERRVKMQTAQLLHLNDEEHKARVEAEKAHADSDRAREQADRANKELERKNKELEQFTYASSHDMKEPLRKISFYNNYVVENPLVRLDEKSKEYLRISTKMKIILYPRKNFINI